MNLRTGWTLLVIGLCLGIWGCGGSDSSNTPATTGIPSDYAALCANSGVTCQAGDSPLSLLGTYTGTGTTVVTSSEIWNVGDSDGFTAMIATQNGGTATGSFELGSFHIDIKQANIRGNDTQFTIYGTDSVVEDNPDAGVQANCSVEARVVITGTQTETSSAMTVVGKTILEFTNNIHGTGCTQDQISNYPGTGAVFDYTATHTP